MAQHDENHWLWRLDAAAWLGAAANELAQGEALIAVRRTAVTHARRAAGMALNAVLVELARRADSPERSEVIWGRSYIDHLRVLADPELDPSLRAPFELELSGCCRELLAISVMPPTGLVSLARARDEAATKALALARQIVETCASFCARAH